MPTNLTGQTIASTFSQLLHVDGGPSASEKVVYSGNGVATALKVGTQSASVDNIRIDGNTVSAITGDLTLGANIAFSSASNARTALGLGTIAVQNASTVAITGGSITGITDLAIADGGTGASTAANARTNLGLGTMATQAASSVAITGGSITGITDLAVADGGTGASTAANARTNLGLGTMALLSAEITAVANQNLLVYSSTNTRWENQTVSSLGFAIATKTADYTVTQSDYTILCDATLAVVTITLPSAATLSGKIYNVKKIDASVNNVVITPTANTIDGAATAVITAQWTSIAFQSDGANWYII